MEIRDSTPASMIKYYGDVPDLSHLPKERQEEIMRGIKRRMRELRRDIEQIMLEYDDSESATTRQPEDSDMK